MRRRIILNSTQARQRFFELLRLADGGHEVLIDKKDVRRTYRIIRVKRKEQKAKA